MSGERFGGFGEGSQASPEEVKSPELARERGQKILEIIGKMEQTLSAAKRKYAGDSEKSLQYATEDDANISAELTQYEQARQEALSLGMTQEANKIENKIGEIRDAWVASRMQNLGGQSSTGESAPDAPGASSASESGDSVEPNPEVSAETPEEPAEEKLTEPDYEALTEHSEGKNWDTSNEELEMILKDWTPEQKLRSPEQAIKELKSDIETTEQEIKVLQEPRFQFFDTNAAARRDRMIEEAQRDILSMKRKIYLIEKNMGKIKDEILPDVSKAAAGGELDDLTPGRSADDEARARRVLDWSHAKYLYDARNGEDGSDAALKAMYLKERSELMKGGMTREQADEAIVQNRGLTKEDLEKLNYDVEDESDEEAYIKAGEEALAAAQKMAEEMHKNQAEGKPIVLDAEFAKKLGELRDQLKEAEAKRDTLLTIDPKTGRPYKAEDSAEVKEIDALIWNLSRQIEEMEEKRIAENTVAESVMLNEADPAAVKKSLWEKLKDRNGLKRVFRKFGTKVAALVLTALTFVGTVDKTVAADNNQIQPASGIEMQTGVASVIEGAADGIVQQAAQMAEQATIDAKNIKDVNLTQMQLEGIFGEAGAREIMNLNDQEYMDEMGYQRLNNNVFYDDDEYQGYGDLGNKSSKYAFAMDHTETWENKDEEETANLLYRIAHENPAVLSAYLANYPDTLEYMGLARDIKAADLYQLMVNSEDGADLQARGLQAFKALLESENTTIEFGTLNGEVRTDYISSPSETSPAERTLKYNKTTRDNAKVFFVNYKAINPDGTTRVDSMVITAACMQNNVFLQSPIKSPSGEPVVVVTDVEIIDEDTDEDVTDTDEDITDTDEDTDETTDEDVDEDTDTDTDTDTDEDITDTDDPTDGSKEDEPNDDSPKEDQPKEDQPSSDDPKEEVPSYTPAGKDGENQIEIANKITEDMGVVHAPIENPGKLNNDGDQYNGKFSSDDALKVDDASGSREPGDLSEFVPTTSDKTASAEQQQKDHEEQLETNLRDAENRPNEKGESNFATSGEENINDYFQSILQESAAREQQADELRNNITDLESETFSRPEDIAAQDELLSEARNELAQNVADQVASAPEISVAEAAQAAAQGSQETPTGNTATGSSESASRTDNYAGNSSLEDDLGVSF